MNHEEIAHIRAIVILLRNQVITYEKAKALAQPFLDSLNTRGRHVAKKHKRRYIPVEFIKFTR